MKSPLKGCIRSAKGISALPPCCVGCSLPRIINRRIEAARPFNLLLLHETGKKKKKEMKTAGEINVTG